MLFVTIMYYVYSVLSFSLSWIWFSVLLCPKSDINLVLSTLMSYIRLYDVMVPTHVLLPLVNREQELTLQHPPMDPSCTLLQICHSWYRLVCLLHCCFICAEVMPHVVRLGRKPCHKPMYVNLVDLWTESRNPENFSWYNLIFHIKLITV